MTGKTLTDKQKAFVENFSKTGNATQSAIASGDSPATAEQQGYELKKKLATEIDHATKQVLASSVPLAIDKLQSLIVDDKVNASVTRTHTHAPSKIPPRPSAYIYIKYART